MKNIQSQCLRMTFVASVLLLGACSTTGPKDQMPDFGPVSDDDPSTKIILAHAPRLLNAEGLTNVQRVTSHLSNNNLAILCNSLAEDDFKDRTGSHLKIHNMTPDQQKGTITTYFQQGSDGVVVPLRQAPLNDNNLEIEELEKLWREAIDDRMTSHVNLTSQLTYLAPSDLEHTFQNILQCAAALNNEFQSEEETTKLYNAVTRVMSRAKAMGAKIPTDEQLEAFLPGISEHIRKHPPLVMREEEAPELIKQ